MKSYLLKKINENRVDYIIEAITELISNKIEKNNYSKRDPRYKKRDYYPKTIKQKVQLTKQ